MPKIKNDAKEEETKVSKEVKEEIIEGIEEGGVPESIAKEEEKIAEKISEKDLKEAESREGTKESKSIEEKKKKLLKKAAELKEKIEETKTEELKEKVKVKKRTDMLLPLEEYVKAGIYLGTKVVTPNMKPFVYRRRADGLAIFNTDLIDEKLKEGIEFLSKFNAEDIILVCKRQAGWKSAKMFGELTGIRVFTKKYPAGALTNTKLSNFFENELTIVTDSWLDKNALNDTLKINKKILMISDTNNFSKGADYTIIGNNKSAKSLGVIFYLLARGYLKEKGLNADKIPDLEWWTSEEEN